MAKDNIAGDKRSVYNVSVSPIPQTFDDLFRIAFGQEVTPFEYQARLAGGKDGRACESKLVNPESIRGGKTAAVILACR